MAGHVTLDQVRDAFSNGERTRITGRAGFTDQQRLAIDPQYIGADGRASASFLTPNRTPGVFAPALFVYDKNTFSWDASATKNFRFTERWRFQLFASASNVLNHPSWGLGNANIFSTSFGTVGAPSGNRSLTFRGVLSF